MFDENNQATKQAKLFCSMVVNVGLAICVTVVAVYQNNINVLWWWLLIPVICSVYTTENRKRGKQDGQIED